MSSLPRPRPSPEAASRPVCPLCGTTVAPSAPRCPECNHALAASPDRARPLGDVSAWALAAMLVGVYVATLVLVAVAR